MTIQKAAKTSGVSVRTLHYYHEIGLLLPTEVTEAGYRLYGDQELARLQQILLFRELDFSLTEIKGFLQQEHFDPKEALLKQRELLILNQKRLENLIALTTRLLKGEQDMSFQEFDQNELDTLKNHYAQEVRQRWGNTKAYEQFSEKTEGYAEKDWTHIKEDMNEIFGEFAVAMTDGPSSEKAQEAVGKWQDFITTRFYTCTPELLLQLSALYTQDERFKKTFEEIQPGLSAFVAEAIAVYALQKSGKDL